MKDNLIAITDICSYEKIEINFVYALADFGLISTKIVKKVEFIEAEDLPKLVRFKHLHQDLEINLEGLHAVAHVLNQLDDVRNEIQRLRNELNYYQQQENVQN